MTQQANTTNKTTACFGLIDTSEENKANKSVQKQLDAWNREDQQVIKLLLLGAGGSGKSTIFKQMKIIHQAGYTKEELDKQREIVKRNVLEIFQIVMNFAIEKELGLEVTEFVEEIQNHTLNTFQLKPELVTPLTELWKTKAMQEAYSRRAEYDLMENVEYFVNSLPRICAPEYTPTNDDILKTRLKTIGIVENVFKVENTQFKMVDVGGQRNERRKWIHAFDSVTSVIFVLAMSEYDQVLAEEEGINRMDESFKLFEDICNHKFFKSIPVVVFFNKSDIFAEKAKKVDLSVCQLFKDYKGGLDAKKAEDFLVSKFAELNTNKKRPFFTHVTNATDTGNIKFVFNAVKAAILQIILNQGNLIT